MSTQAIDVTGLIPVDFESAFRLKSLDSSSDQIL
jgi:hypothetical protein